MHEYRLEVRPTEAVVVGRRVKVLALAPMAYVLPDVPPTQLDTYDPHVVGTVTSIKRIRESEGEIATSAKTYEIKIKNNCQNNMVEGIVLRAPEEMLLERQGSEDSEREERRRGPQTERRDGKASERKEGRPTERQSMEDAERKGRRRRSQEKRQDVSGEIRDAREEPRQTRRGGRADEEQRERKRKRGPAMPEAAGTPQLLVGIRPWPIEETVNCDGENCELGDVMMRARE